MKLAPIVGEHRYAVAVREGTDLWLTLWVRRSPKGEFFKPTEKAVFTRSLASARSAEQALNAVSSTSLLPGSLFQILILHQSVPDM